MLFSFFFFLIQRDDYEIWFWALKFYFAENIQIWHFNSGCSVAGSVALNAGRTLTVCFRLAARFVQQSQQPDFGHSLSVCLSQFLLAHCAQIGLPLGVGSVINSTKFLLEISRGWCFIFFGNTLVGPDCMRVVKLLEEYRLFPSWLFLVFSMFGNPDLSRDLGLKPSCGVGIQLRSSKFLHRPSGVGRFNLTQEVWHHFISPSGCAPQERITGNTWQGGDFGPYWNSSMVCANIILNLWLRVYSCLACLEQLFGICENRVHYWMR